MSKHSQRAYYQGLATSLYMPSGCRFHPRCAKAMPHCSTTPPDKIAFDDGHIECHFYDENEENGKLAS